jgi:threonine dehydrogenase-like Zn-dependent dehydrogenase
VRHYGTDVATLYPVAQAEAVGVPFANATLVRVPVGEESELLPDLLALSDVYCTGYHAAIKGELPPAHDGDGN